MNAVVHEVISTVQYCTLSRKINGNLFGNFLFFLEYRECNTESRISKSITGVKASFVKNRILFKSDLHGFRIGVIRKIVKFSHKNDVTTFVGQYNLIFALKMIPGS